MGDGNFGPPQNRHTSTYRRARFGEDSAPWRMLFELQGVSFLPTKLVATATSLEGSKK